MAFKYLSTNQENDMTNHITLSAETIKLLSPACKAELAAHLGFDSAPTPNPFMLDESEEEFAELGIQAARAFLQGCGEKTILAIGLIVESGDSFSIAKIAADMGVDAASLRGVWAGLTKRVRTITGDPEAALIAWEPQSEDDDYIGRMMPVTREAFRRALAE